tara:strand:+ start:1122 stop:1451 length:330 start_codon:yes stop_codon:yes gene_type:complete
MDDKKVAAEIESAQAALQQEYDAETDVSATLANLFNEVVKSAETYIAHANNTTSYDEKIDALIAGLQECVQAVAQSKRDIEAKKLKYEHQLEIITTIKKRLESYADMPV